jgi:hypothetical protein
MLKWSSRHIGVRLSLPLSVVVFAILVCASAFAQDEHDNPTNGFYLQRSYPSARIPAAVLSEARKKLAQQKTRSPLVLPGVNWNSIGPQPTNPRDVLFEGSPLISGRVTALGVDSSNPKRVFLGAAEGGVWRTLDGGVTWTPLTDNQVTLSTGSIAIDPLNPQTIFVGTGEQDYLNSYYGAGILKSTDGGNTWTQLPGPFVGPFGASGGGAYIGSIAVDPTNDLILFAGVLSSGPDGSGIYQSTDGGTTWSVVLSGPAGNVVFFDPTNHLHLYAALGACGSVCGGVSGTSGVYESTNGGGTWTMLSGGLPTTNVGRIGLALSTSSPTTLYAGIADSSSGALLSFWKTTDGGATWMQLTIPDYCDPQCWFDNVVAVSPNDSSVVYVGGKANIYQSLDGGTTWNPVSVGANGLANVHNDTHALTFAADGSLLYVGGDGGTWVTSDVNSLTVNWAALNSPLAITQFYKGFSISPSAVNTTFGGTQDNGTQQYSGTSTWDSVICADGGATAIDPVHTNNVYAVCIANSGPTVYKSTSGGTLGTFVTAQSGITTSDRAFFGETLVIDPANSQTLYFGTYRIYQSTNGAQSWSLISGDLTNGGYISALAVAPGNSQVVYAVTSDGNVWVTTNAGSGTGATWSKVDTGLPNRWVTEVFPTSPTAAYVTYSGFNFAGGIPGHVFLTTNLGQTWTDVSGDLPNIPVNDIVTDPQASNLIYAATDVGILGTSDGGATWSVLGNGLPNVAAVGLRIHAGARILRTATHGRSMWDLQLQDFGVSVAPNSITVTAGQKATTVITVSPNTSGFSTPVTLSCSSLPAGAVCAFSANPVTPGASAVTVNLTITTAMPQGALRLATPLVAYATRATDDLGAGCASPASGTRSRAGFAIYLPLIAACLCLLDYASKRKRRLLLPAASVAICIVLLVFQVGCGGSSSPPPPSSQPPTFTSASSATFHVGSANSFTVATTGDPTPTVTEAGSLPDGVTFTPDTKGGGTLGGTPTTPGMSNLIFTASNTAGSAKQNFTLTTTTSNSFNVAINGNAGGVQHAAALQLTVK